MYKSFYSARTRKIGDKPLFSQPLVISQAYSGQNKNTYTLHSEKNITFKKEPRKNATFEKLIN